MEILGKGAGVQNAAGDAASVGRRLLAGGAGLGLRGRFRGSYRATTSRCLARPLSLSAAFICLSMVATMLVSKLLQADCPKLLGTGLAGLNRAGLGLKINDM
jgi:hypothetical protein